MLLLQAVATQAALAAQVHHQVQAAPTLFIPAAYYPAYPVSIPAHHPAAAGGFLVHSPAATSLPATPVHRPPTLMPAAAAGVHSPAAVILQPVASAHHQLHAHHPSVTPVGAANISQGNHGQAPSASPGVRGGPGGPAGVAGVPGSAGAESGVPSVGIHDGGVHQGVHPGAVRTLVGGGENPSSVRESSITARGTSPELHQSMSVDSCMSGEEAKPVLISSLPRVSSIRVCQIRGLEVAFVKMERSSNFEP